MCKLRFWSIVECFVYNINIIIVSLKNCNEFSIYIFSLHIFSGAFNLNFGLSLLYQHLVIIIFIVLVNFVILLVVLCSFCWANLVIFQSQPLKPHPVCRHMTPAPCIVSSADTALSQALWHNCESWLKAWESADPSGVNLQQVCGISNAPLAWLFTKHGREMISLENTMNHLDMGSMTIRMNMFNVHITSGIFVVLQKFVMA